MVGKCRAGLVLLAVPLARAVRRCCSYPAGVSAIVSHFNPKLPSDCVFVERFNCSRYNAVRIWVRSKVEWQRLARRAHSRITLRSLLALLPRRSLDNDIATAKRGNVAAWREAAERIIGTAEPFVNCLLPFHGMRQQSPESAAAFDADAELERKAYVSRSAIGRVAFSRSLGQHHRGSVLLLVAEVRVIA